MLPNVQTFNFVVLMIFFMAVLWLIKVFVRVRKLYRLYYALERNVVIRLDGEVSNSQHLDALSLSHIQQILNANLTQSSTVVPEVYTSAHIEPKTVQIVKSEHSSSDFMLKFSVEASTPCRCVVYFGPSKKGVKDFCSRQRELGRSPELKARRMLISSDLLEPEEYLYKKTIDLFPGVRSPGEVEVPAVIIEKISTDNATIAPRYAAIIHATVKKEMKDFQRVYLGDEITVVAVRIRTSTTSPQLQNEAASPNTNQGAWHAFGGVTVDHQLVVGHRKQLMHIRDVFGEEEEESVLFAFQSPKTLSFSRAGICAYVGPVF
eukprot:CAMPEP_0184479244 /NCGR_PEP_ID=MMETSP0113_2-20130426/1045_1 /TAXON_ID=91329 /ORGANISM="Norrisiella sphaerica, Strain BC52" /LENGTH=318 /DNA_ID=CAMNT_0026857281 /DNA_START=197 /DNA_END=1154 /DNA_ORIENTATION=+